MAHSIAYALGGTNIGYRINLAIEEFNDGRTDAVGFLGAWQGRDAAKQFAESGIPPYSQKSGRGYVVPSADISKTTIQNAVYGRLLADFYGFDEVCICTEPYHGVGALDDFMCAFQRISLKTVPVDESRYGKPPEHAEAAPLRKLHEMLRGAFEPFYADVTPARSRKQLTALWERDWHLAEAVYNPLRDRVETPAFKILKRSTQTPLVRALARPVDAAKGLATFK